jgi:hypothetical protein
MKTAVARKQEALPKWTAQTAAERCMEKRGYVVIGHPPRRSDGTPNAFPKPGVELSAFAGGSLGDEFVLVVTSETDPADWKAQLELLFPHSSGLPNYKRRVVPGSRFWRCSLERAIA